MKPVFARHSILWSIVFLVIIFGYLNLFSSSTVEPNSESETNFLLLSHFVHGGSLFDLSERKSSVESPFLAELYLDLEEDSELFLVEDRIVSQTPIGAVVLALPSYILYHLSNISLQREVGKSEAFFVARTFGVTIPLLFFIWFFGRFTQRISEESAIRFLTLVALCIASPLWLAAIQFSGKSLFIGSVFTAYIQGYNHQSNPKKILPALLFGFSLGIALLSSAFALPAVLLLSLFVVYLSPVPKRFFSYAAISFIPLLLLLLFYNKFAFGSFFLTPNWDLSFVSDPALSLVNFWYIPPTGLLWLSPWVLLGLLSIVTGLHRSKNRNDRLLSIAFILFYAVLLPLRSSKTFLDALVILPFLAYHTGIGLDHITKYAGRHIIFVFAAGSVLISSISMAIIVHFLGFLPFGLVNPVVELGFYFLMIDEQWYISFISMLIVVLIPTFSYLFLWSSPNVYGRQGIIVTVSTIAVVFGVVCSIPRTTDANKVDQMRNAWITEEYESENFSQRTSYQTADSCYEEGNAAAAAGYPRRALIYFLESDQIASQDERNETLSP